MGNGPGAQEGSPVVAVDPLNPQKIVAVWVNNDTADIRAPAPQVFLEGEYSVNGGQSWTAFNSVDFVLPDPNTTNPTVPYLQVTNPSVSFDRNGNFYVLADQHNAALSSGALVLQKYSFTGDAPVAARLRQPSGGSSTYKIIYQWLPSSDLAYEPTLAVDDNLASFTDPTTGQVQTDSSAGNVYVAWASGSVAPDSVLTLSAPFGTGLFNGNVIKMATSTDGGQDFTAPIVMTQSAPNQSQLALYGPTTERDAVPAIAISQGRLPSESGQAGDVGVPGGQVTVGWTDTATNEHRLLANSLLPGRDFGFDGSSGSISFGTTTDFTTSVQIPANQIAALTSLSLTVDITDSTDSMLGLKLIAPGGESIYLFTNQTDLGGNNISVRGITGANVGVNNGFLVGTTFTDSAARSIVDISANGGRGAASPYVGNYRVENDPFVADADGRNLTAFLNKVLADAAQGIGSINGTWKLETIDTNTNAPSTPATVDFWTLNLASGMKAGCRRAGWRHSWACHRWVCHHAIPDGVGCFANRCQSRPGHGLR